MDIVFDFQNMSINNSSIMLNNFYDVIMTKLLNGDYNLDSLCFNSNNWIVTNILLESTIKKTIISTPFLLCKLCTNSHDLIVDELLKIDEIVNNSLGIYDEYLCENSNKRIVQLLFAKGLNVERYPNIVSNCDDDIVDMMIAKYPQLILDLPDSGSNSNIKMINYLINNVVDLYNNYFTYSNQNDVVCDYILKVLDILDTSNTIDMTLTLNIDLMHWYLSQNSNKKIIMYYSNNMENINWESIWTNNAILPN